MQRYTTQNPRVHTSQFTYESHTLGATPAKTILQESTAIPIRITYHTYRNGPNLSRGVKHLSVVERERLRDFRSVVLKWRATRRAMAGVERERLRDFRSVVLKWRATRRAMAGVERERLRDFRSVVLKWRATRRAMAGVERERLRDFRSVVLKWRATRRAMAGSESSCFLLKPLLLQYVCSQWWSATDAGARSFTNPVATR